jgi:hypothetical protein
MENQNYTPGPWKHDGNTTYILGSSYIVASVQVGLDPFIQMANAKRIVDCVNACEGQPLDLVELANEHYRACIEWERLMMELVGEDGPGSAKNKIEFLKNQNAAFSDELKNIRNHIGADENESTYDEVVRLTRPKKSNWFKRLFQ